LPRLPKALPLHHPTADELHHAHAVYTEKEPTEYAHRLSRHLLEGDAFTAGEALHALLRIWSPKGPKTTPAGISAVLDKTADARAAFADRHIATLVVAEHHTVKVIYAAFKGAVGQVSAAKALSVLHPRFFPMWDTKIALAYLGWRWRTQGAPPEHYLLFMGYAIEQCTTAVNEDAFGDTLLKVLDEWNYSIWTKKWLTPADSADT
jgi:hypothetical protein